MPQKPEAYLASVLYNPQTKQADQAVVIVQYGPKTARVNIELPSTPIDSPNLADQVPQLLRELGEALRHIQDAPLALHTLHRLRI
jgi:hypothetical protein